MHRYEQKIQFYIGIHSGAFAVILFSIRWKIFFYSLEIKNARKTHYFFIVNFIIFTTDDIKIVNSVNFVNRQFRVVFTKTEFEGEWEEGDFFEYYKFLLSFAIYYIYYFLSSLKKEETRKYRKGPQHVKLTKLTIDKIDD